MSSHSTHCRLLLICTAYRLLCLGDFALSHRCCRCGCRKSLSVRSDAQEPKVPKPALSFDIFSVPFLRLLTSCRNNQPQLQFPLFRVITVAFASPTLTEYSAPAVKACQIFIFVIYTYVRNCLGCHCVIAYNYCILSAHLQRLKL